MKFVLKNNKGMALSAVLFILMAILISSFLLLRSNDISILVAGNVGSRTDVTNSNEKVISDAIGWVKDNTAALDNNDAAAGYYSSIPAITDFSLDSSWAGAYSYDELNAAGVATGNKNSYIIYRLCTLANVAVNGSLAGVQNECQTEPGTSTSNSTTGSSFGYNGTNFNASYTGTTVFYKVIAKTIGMKGATIITETVVKI